MFWLACDSHLVAREVLTLFMNHRWLVTVTVCPDRSCVVPRYW